MIFSLSDVNKNASSDVLLYKCDKAFEFFSFLIFFS